MAISVTTVLHRHFPGGSRNAFCWIVPTFAALADKGATTGVCKSWDVVLLGEQYVRDMFNAAESKSG
jgi:hypothetical protein